MKMKLLPIVFCLIGLTASAQMNNIKLAELAEGTYFPAGVSVAINHKDQKNLVAAFGVNHILYTLDGGKTWKESKPASPFGSAGDPTLISDSKGNFYYFHLSDPGGKGRDDAGWLDRIVCQTSADSGITWTPGASIGNNLSKDQASPRASGSLEESNICLTWTQFDQFGSQEASCQSNIMFSHSTSHGKRWSDPVQINTKPGDCSNDDNTTGSAIAAVNPEGRMFVAWSNGGTIFLDRSYNGGDTWLSSDIVVAQQPGGSFMSIPGIGKCSGMPTLVVDNSETFFRGSLYIVWADQSSGENDTDIWLSRSTNRGDTWTKPQRINQDGAGKHQFLPAVTVDQATGIVYIIYYDRRAHDDLQTDVYLAYSLDGTNHFAEIKISESSFLPSAGKSPGDYIGIAAHKGVIAPIWTRLDDGHVNVLTKVIRQEELFKKEDMPKLQTMRRPVRSSGYTPSPSQGIRRR